MIKTVSDDIQIQLMNFNDGKREEWEKKRYPYSALIELTAKCNLNCVHCYLQNHHEEAELSLERIKEILDVLFEKGILFLTFTGGEIFTRNDFIEIYTYAKKKGFLIELFSNGLVVSDEVIALLKKYPPILFDVSLYGASNETYYKVTGNRLAYDRVISNCKRLINEGIRVALRTPILSFNYQEIKLMKEIAKKLGVVYSTSFEISPTIDKNDVSQKYQLDIKEILAYESFEYFENEKRVTYPVTESKDGSSLQIFSCKMGKGALVIDYYGNMFPCMKFRHIGKQLTKDNFEKLWKSYEKYNLMMTSKDNKCNRCDANYYCEICPAEMDFLYGDVEYRNKTVCKIAYYRKMLYEGKLSSYENAIQKLKDIDF